MKRLFLIIAVVVGVLVAWLVLGRQLVLAVDAFMTEGNTVPTAGPFVASTGSLHIGNVPLDLATPDGDRDRVGFEVYPDGRIVLNADGKTFALGPANDLAIETVEASAGPYDVVFAPNPGDMVTFRTAHSVIGWPTPFDLNFMTGKSPSWKRNVYYTLAWRKSGGATLEMTWRYEQWFYDDWGSPMMIREGATGLIDVSIAEPK